MTYRLQTLLFPFLLNGCVSLPDMAPPLSAAQMPHRGDLVAEIRHVFGDPQVLDSGRYLIYDWTTDRQMVLVPVGYTGLSGATVTAGHRFRMRIVLDDTQRVSSVDCSIEKLDSSQLSELGCLDPAGMRALAGPAEWHELADIAGLADVRFWHSEMSGSNTNMVLSPNGSLLAASDVQNRTWIVDLESFTLVGHSDNTPPDFWSLKGIPEPRAAFTDDEQRVAITQGDVISLLFRSGDRFTPEVQLTVHDLKVAAFDCCSDGLTGLGAGQASRITLGGETRDTVEGEGRLKFGVSGVAVTRRSPSGSLRVAALDSASLKPSPRAIFRDNSHENLVLDPRNDFARHSAPANFEFSRDGRWLARNSCRHLELWDSSQLFDRLSNESTEVITPDAAMVMTLSSDPGYDGGCHGPIAFHPGGKMVAAASKKAIHIWRTEGGTQEILLDFEERGHGLHVVAIAFDATHHLVAVASDYRGTLYVARWSLPDTL
ncbi:MAG: WD40 repeat domain-containing protein [Woeseiaceae bacterium]|nr:WD40 repeat domain-containing protein [Woeseiaceae bacterium]